MALQRFTSKQLMDIMDTTYNKIETLQNDFIEMNENLKTKLSVIRNIQDYEAYKFEELKTLLQGGTNDYRNKIVFGRAEADGLIVDGSYSSFGTTIHPRLLNTPTDIFNFKTVTGYTYKDNATVSITPVGTEEENKDPKYLGALCHDTIENQPLCFEEFTDNVINISITVSPGELLGSVGFNMIEIVPYLPGSFDISTLEIYSLQGYYLNSQVADSTFPNPVKSVGICRLLIEDTIDLYRLNMTIKLNWKNPTTEKYPFGLKHLYFLNAAYDPDSYVVVKVPQSKYIDSISEDITVWDQTGKVDATCKTEGIELFYNWSAGVGVDTISTTKGLTINQLARNTREFIFRYPIYRSTTALMFNEIKLRNT